MARYIESEEEHPLATDYFYYAIHAIDPQLTKVISHTHDFYEFYIYLGESIQILMDVDTYTVGLGDILIIPPGMIHSISPLNIINHYDRMCLYVTPAYLSSLQFQKYSPLALIKEAIENKHFLVHIEKQGDFAVIRNCVNMIGYNRVNYKVAEKELENRGYLMLFLSQLLLYLGKNHQEESNQCKKVGVSDVISFINENYMNPITIKDLCSRFYTNHQFMCKEFKKSTAMTIHQYIILVRVSQAKHLLSEGELAMDVYTKCGFMDYSTFYRAFLKIEGISPRKFAALIW